MEKIIRQKQSETVKCSFLYAPIILLFSIIIISVLIFFDIMEINFFILTPIILAIILIPFQALFFDIFNTSRQYLTFRENDLLDVDARNKFFDDIQQTNYSYSDVINVELKFKYIKCLETITINFKNNKKLQLVSFYFTDDDFKWMKNFLSSLPRKKEKKGAR